MKPKINVLENGIPVTREMTEEEYAEYLEMQVKAEHEAENM